MEAASSPASGRPVKVGALSARVVLRVVLTVVLVVLALYLLYLLRRPLTWIFIAGFLAIALSGPVNLLSRYMKRGLAIACVYIALILIPILLGALLIPPVVEQLNNLINNLPQYVSMGVRPYWNARDGHYLGPAHDAVPLRIDPARPLKERS